MLLYVLFLSIHCSNYHVYWYSSDLYLSCLVSMVDKVIKVHLKILILPGPCQLHPLPSRCFACAVLVILCSRNAIFSTYLKHGYSVCSVHRFH